MEQQDLKNTNLFDFYHLKAAFKTLFKMTLQLIQTVFEHFEACYVTNGVERLQREIKT